MTTTVITSNQSWVCPTGVTKIDVALYGGGGGGGVTTVFGANGRAGVNGSTTTKTLISVTPGTSYPIVVGAGGTKSWWNAGLSIVIVGTAGGDSTGFGWTGAGGANGGENAGDPVPVGNAGAGGVPRYADGADGTGGSVTITYNLPSATFTGTPLVGPKPLSVDFTGPADCTTYAWDFGDDDDTDDDIQSPTHSYTTPGKKTVILATTNDYGSNATTRTGYVNVLFKTRKHCAGVCSDELRKV